MVKEKEAALVDKYRGRRMASAVTEWTSTAEDTVSGEELLRSQSPSQTLAPNVKSNMSKTNIIHIKYTEFLIL